MEQLIEEYGISILLVIVGVAVIQAFQSILLYM